MITVGNIVDLLKNYLGETFQELFMGEAYELKIVKRLVNIKDGTGKTALHYAAENCFYTIAFKLIYATDCFGDYATDLTIMDRKNKTPLDYAKAKGYLMLINTLRNAEATR